MADYSKWEAMARAEEEAERREKEQKRAANRDKYFREQEEKKAKYLQEQEAKKKVSRRSTSCAAEMDSSQWRRSAVQCSAAMAHRTTHRHLLLSFILSAYVCV